jgi:peptidoglycan/xylan/chitin deacetylase (PgdA/CDA1 family)
MGIVSCKKMSRQQVRNFLFHQVNPKRDPIWDPVDVPLFYKCIRYISKKYKIIPVEYLPDIRPEFIHKYATISLDDGYKDNITFAAPVLDKYKVKASFFVVTDCVEKNIPTWTHELEYLFQHTGKIKIDLCFDFMSHSMKVSELLNADQRISYVKKLVPFIKTLTNEQRELVIETVRTTFDDVEIPGMMMDWNDIRQLANHGHAIGSHTVTHRILTDLKNEAEIKKELVDSGNLIAKHIGRFPEMISYPIGYYNENIISQCKEAGYKIGLTTRQDVYDPQKNSVFEIPRIGLCNEPWWKTQMRITNMLEKIKKTIRYNH